MKGTDPQDPMTIVVTGAAGFIGSNLVRSLLSRMPETRVIALDALTYSGSLANLESLRSDPRFEFVHGDIADRDVVRDVFDRHDPGAIFHLAAESHVDRSIEDPMRFVETNVVGTVVLLQEALSCWGNDRERRFIHVSTDEVYGSLEAEGLFDENSPYRPNSPYSASKAASDHFVRAWGETYGLPVMITNCSNNYGPRQFPEKLIPVVISRALGREPVPVYGDGSNVRDWLHVSDHCEALVRVLEAGTVGATYCIGGRSPVSNLELVRQVLDAVDRVQGREPGTSRDLIAFVRDRPGHDFRYAIDPTLIESELNWRAGIDLEQGIRDTVEWYLSHSDWLDQVSGEEHRRFVESWYSDREESK